MIGAGLTGIEVACEMPHRLRRALGGALGAEPRVSLVESAPEVGPDMGQSARPVILEALGALGVDVRTGASLAAVDEEGVILAGGERLAARTVVLATGLRASPLTATFPVEGDRCGRLRVDPLMRVRGVDKVYAAGDVASAMIDSAHATVMSCQHARPTGRIAGHNVVCDLLGEDPSPLRIDYYVTCLDLGAWGAVFTRGWDRQVALKGAEAKEMKQTINCVRIYPPRSGDGRELLDWAAPAPQTAPSAASGAARR